MPEKPLSSAYSLFSKEMLNTEFIKQFPSKERMSHISEAWKKVTESDKEVYQTQVNEAMARYKTEYTEWYEALTSEEQRVEKERTTTKTTKKPPLTPILTPSSVLPATPTAYLPQQQQFTISSPMAQQQLQMPAITVPYPNITGSQAGQPMFVKVEVVGAPGGHTAVTQCQQMPHSMAQPPFTLGPIMAAAPQVAAAPPPPLVPPPQPPKVEEPGRLEALRAEILRREPVEPARSHKQLFLSDYVKKA